MKEWKIHKRLLKKVWRQTFFLQKKKKYNTYKETKEKYDNKQKYKDTPIDKRVSDAVLKGSKEDLKIRNADMVEEHKYDYWWLGGKKTRKTKQKEENMGINKYYYLKELSYLEKENYQ